MTLGDDSIEPQATRRFAFINSTLFRTEKKYITATTARNIRVTPNNSSCSSANINTPPNTANRMNNTNTNFTIRVTKLRVMNTNNTAKRLLVTYITSSPMRNLLPFAPSYSSSLTPTVPPSSPESFTVSSIVTVLGFPLTLEDVIIVL
jgi:hypothetical protein